MTADPLALLRWSPSRWPWTSSIASCRSAAPDLGCLVAASAWIDQDTLILCCTTDLLGGGLPAIHGVEHLTTIGLTGRPAPAAATALMVWYELSINLGVTRPRAEVPDKHGYGQGHLLLQTPSATYVWHRTMSMHQPATIFFGSSSGDGRASSPRRVDPGKDPGPLDGLDRYARQPRAEDRSHRPRRSTAHMPWLAGLRWLCGDTCRWSQSTTIPDHTAAQCLRRPVPGARGIKLAITPHPTTLLAECRAQARRESNLPGSRWMAALNLVHIPGWRWALDCAGSATPQAAVRVGCG